MATKKKAAPKKAAKKAAPKKAAKKAAPKKAAKKAAEYLKPRVVDVEVFYTISPPVKLLAMEGGFCYTRCNSVRRVLV
jgi:hypothetical protein